MRINGENKFIKKGEYLLKGRNENLKVKVTKDFEYKEPGDLLAVKVLEGPDKDKKMEVDIRLCFLEKLK